MLNLTPAQARRNRWIAFGAVLALPVGLAVFVASLPSTPRPVPAPATAASGSDRAAPVQRHDDPPPGFDVSKPAYLAKEAVICDEMTLLGTYLDGHRAGGEAEGHRAVAALFVHPRGECARTFARESVRVLDATVSRDKYVKIQWAGERWMARSRDLSN